MAFLWSINPETGFVGGIPADRQDEAIGHYTDTWDPLRGDLEALRVADPRLAVDAQAAATITAITDSFTASVWAMRRRGDAEHTHWDDLRAKYQAALAAAEELRRLVR